MMEHTSVVLSGSGGSHIHPHLGAKPEDEGILYEDGRDSTTDRALAKLRDFVASLPERPGFRALPDWVMLLL